MLPNFELAPWEAGILPDSEPVCAPATRRIEFRQGWRKVAYLVRDLQKPIPGVGRVIVQRDASGSVTLVPQFDVPDPLKPASRSKSDAELIEAIKNKKWTRTVFLNNDLKLLAPGEMSAHRISITGDNRTAMYGVWGIPIEFLLDGRPRRKEWGETIPAKRLEFLLNRGWQKTTSDCHFALRWASLSFEEHVRWLYECERSTVDECEEVLRWFVVGGSWWDSAYDALLVLDPSEDEKQSRARKHPLPLAQCRLLVTPKSKDLVAEWIELSASQRQVLGVLDRYFGLRYNKECWRHLSLNLWRSVSWIIQVHEVPTQHERIEARLQLRDWLQDKVALDELATLME